MKKLRLEFHRFTYVVVDVVDVVAVAVVVVVTSYHNVESYGAKYTTYKTGMI